MKKFDYGENIDPVELNNNLRDVETLLSQAYKYNNELKVRQNMLDMALGHILNAADSYVDTAQPDATMYNAATTNNGPYNTFWAGNPPRLVTPITFDGTETMNNLDVVRGKLVLKSKASHSKIPLVKNDYNEDRPAAGTTILMEAGSEKIELGDQELAWAILSPDLIWCYRSSTSSITLSISTPPSSSPVVNHISTDAIFPNKEHTIKYVNAAGRTVPLGSQRGSSDFYFPGDKFGGRIVLILNGISVGSNTYVYGLSQVRASEEVFQPSGYLLKEISLYNNATYLGDKSLFLDAINYNGTIPASRFSDAVRIQLGHGLNEERQDLVSVLFDSDIHPLENPSGIDLGIGGTIWAKITLNLVNKDTTPSLSGLLMEYSVGV